MRPRFAIRTVLGLTFAACLLLAIVTQRDSVVAGILIAVLMANFVGVVVALLVTFVFKFPRDGSFRYRLESDNEDLNPAAETQPSNPGTSDG